MGINSSVLLAGDSFDPYPYILLNLGLSSLAAFQAPIIMMSQNRQAAKDRIKQDAAYEINLKLELEIMRLHDQLNQLIDEDKKTMKAVLLIVLFMGYLLGVSMLTKTVERLGVANGQWLTGSRS